MAGYRVEDYSIPGVSLDTVSHAGKLLYLCCCTHIILMTVDAQ